MIRKRWRGYLAANRTGQCADTLACVKDGILETTGLYFENEMAHVTVQGSISSLWTYTCKVSARALTIASPIFEIDGVPLPAELAQIQPLGQPERLTNGCVEYRCQGTFVHVPDLALELIFRIADDNPVVRFAYILKSQSAHRLTRASGHDALTYLGISLADFPQVKDVHFSDFVELVHSYCLAEYPVEARAFEHNLTITGPLLCAENTTHALLIAYEHGSQGPDAFLQYHLLPERMVALQATKGNYYGGQPLDPNHPYQTLWLQVAAVEGDATTLAKAYRTFVLQYQSLYNESRKPSISYNTWNSQERNKWWHGHSYHETIHQEHILQEIEAAARIGVEVFVINTGWYDKAGDWEVNRASFHDDLKSIKQQLSTYGMQLGLWFNPTVAAASSSTYTNYASCERSLQGEAKPPHHLWDAEKNHDMCLVSPYGDHFTDTLIHLAKEVGVTYFKLDGIHQYGCDSPQHAHGDTTSSEQERADCYAFQLVRTLTHIADRVCAAIPGAVVEFDVTEPERPMGLGLLAAGKYSLMNNGPYYQSYDIPVEAGQALNSLFVHPGQARAWIARTPLSYDKWLPSVLLLTHYLADDPHDSQLVNLASLILGQNGLWGELTKVSAEGADFISDILCRYKVLRDDIAHAYPLCTGGIGGSPEIHEKICDEGRGAVLVFSTAVGSYSYVTAHRVGATIWQTNDVDVTIDPQGRALITMTFRQRGAKIILFDE